MDIFKLFGTVAINNNEANTALDDTAKKGSDAEGKLSKAFGKIGSAAVTAGKVVATGMAACATAVTGIVTKSVGAYAEYEQLVGGVETLFGDAANELIYKSALAYQTAGMSANEYMSTVTSFSASLIQSLGGDTKKAVAYADMAITDMSDNANKMGTDISMIQNAYQGFAKQNYTMLDNLKLGYGGTQEEMVRLLKDADALSDQFNLMTDENGDLVFSYADIVDAIHIMQKEMGIAGATSAEASTTIEGSVKAMKASWDNLLTSLATGDESYVEFFVQTFVDSATTALDNLLPRIATALGGISTALEQIMPVVAAELPGILEALLPGLIAGASALLTGLISALPSLLEILIAEIPNIVVQIGAALVEAWPVLLESVKSLAGQLWDYIFVDLLGTSLDFETTMSGIKEWLETTFAPVVDVVSSAFGWLSEKVGEAKEALLPFIEKISEYVTSGEAANDVTDAIHTAFDKIAVLWNETLKPCFDALVSLVVDELYPAFTNAFNEIAPVVEWAFGAIVELWDTFLYPTLLDVIEFFTGIFSSDVSEAFDAVTAAFGYISDVVMDVYDAVAEYFPMIQGIISDVFDIIERVWNEVLLPVFSAIKDYIENTLKPTWDEVFNGFIKPCIDSVFSAIDTAWNEILKPVLNGIIDFVSNVFQGDWEGAWDSITGIFEDLISGMETYISERWESIKSIFSDAIEAIKGFFDFEFKWPNIPMPHFSISPAGWKIGDLLKGSIPSLDIDWYAKAMDNAMLLNDPTIFGMNGNGQLMGGGEAGQEVVAGSDTLMNMIGDTVDAKVSVAFEKLCRYMDEVIGVNQEMLNAIRNGHVLELDGRELGRTVKTYA